ncbi:MAG TPA: hypothetical protein VFU93_05960 [Acidimicrobiales bacterium]|nr:hypothetical protein [Acidimicrobiales bacterium]
MKRAVALAAFVLVVLSASEVLAADPSIARVGWWTRSPSADAPEGGVVVGAAADGAESIAAIEVDLDGGADGVQLALAEAGGSLQDAASVLVCVTDDTWVPADGGDLADAPEPDCDESVAMVREDGTWQADVGALLEGRVDRVTLVLVPSPSATPIPGVLVPFEVELEQPVLTAPPSPTTSRPASPTPTTPRSTMTTPVTVSPPPAVTAPATTSTTVPEADPPSPTPAALGVEETRRIWRWGLWLRIVLAGALAGTAAGLARWKLVSRMQATTP